MIIEFSFSNFFSFKEKVSFNMTASSGKELCDNYVILDNKKILKTAALYGANASGKTNIIKILTSVILMLRNSNYVNINAKIPVVPFKFDNDFINRPSEFEIKFIIDDIRYVYGFSADVNKIYEEYLYYYPNNKLSKIFDRTECNKYSFPREDKKFLEDIKLKNADNKFFIATATNWNFEKTKKPFEFLTTSINTLSNIAELRDASLKEYIKEEPSLKKFALDMLTNADFNIVDFKPLETELPDDVYLNLPDFFKVGMKEKPKVYNAAFKHKNSNNVLSLDEESIGTQLLFLLIPFIKDAMNNKKILFIDELDKSLHPFLVEMIVQMFNSSEINKNGAQLIFNTHDTNLLDLNILRRDQIWFTEKNNDNGDSDLYSLRDFPALTRDKICKGYMLGKYGAIPFINNDLNLWPEE